MSGVLKEPSQFDETVLLIIQTYLKAKRLENNYTCFFIWFFTSQSTNVQLSWDGSSFVELVLSKDKSDKRGLMLWLFVGPTGVYLLDFFCSGIQFNLLLSPYPCFISLLYLDLYVLGDDALMS